MANPHPHFLIITFPAQGHINPALELAKRLIGVGADVTFATTIHAKSRLVKNPTVDGLRFSTFSDGQEEGVKRGPNDLLVFQRLASENLSELIMASANEGRPISCLIYSILIPGAAELARSFNIPSAFLWIQPATVLDIYYYYFNGFGDLIRSKSSDPSFSIELPGLPSLSRQDLPSFFVGSDQNQENHALAAFQKHLEILEQEENPKALVNTFDALEPEALRAVEKLKLTAVGPLVPSGFSDGKDASYTPSGGDLSDGSRDYMEWLKSKPESTVVYVSFGSISMFSMQQMEEIARGLLESEDLSCGS
ncbi:Crocetin glucosyltransferase, chloroplastic [Vitis vinifera]|uniref:Crocetin glucosyltransferase, chloroplastic n=1 Tax=Vitis vinifera TaxID=29760 RepID=A0A438D9W1_VITVI|nr:Crocetin glucosyltransferase, chloroplastic [Vitis vinifera]RVW84392.1 Crocetin glucosyltransferase, chloroplastic [Vitis vinifera]